MGVKLADLRRVCQLPVRDSNDVAGLIYGDYASLPITKLFVDLRISPDVASVGFFVAGLLGSALQVASGWWAALASGLLVLYYLLDCVDGEVARWRAATDLRWGYFDYLFHMLVKPLCFCGVGIGAWLDLHHPWPLLAACAAALATLWLKIFLAIPGIVFVRSVLADPGGPPERYVAAVRAAVPVRRGQPFRLGFNAVTLRAVMTNFDMGLVFLFAAALGDALGSPLSLPALGEVTLRHLWLAYYSVVLPLDFLDYLATYLRRGHFDAEMTRLVGLAHAFDAHRRRAGALAELSRGDPRS
jgi:hypothetical protein